MKFRSAIVAAISSLSIIACSGAEEGGSSASNIDVDYVAGDVLLGSPDAPVKIIEYASTTCGHCRTFHKTILPRIKENYVDTGQVSIVFRDLPTPPAPVSAAGGALARCSGEDEYYATLDDLFTNQYEIIEAARTGGAIGELEKIGARHGLSKEEVRACIMSSKVMDEIGRTSDLATADNVNSTPQLIVNGENAGEALRTYETLAAFLDEKLGIEPEAEPAEIESAEPAVEATDTEEAEIGSTEAAE